MSDLRDSIEFQARDHGFEGFRDLVDFLKDESLFDTTMFDRRIYDWNGEVNRNTYINFTPGQALHAIDHELQNEGYTQQEVVTAFFDYIDNFRADQEVLPREQLIEKYKLDPHAEYFDHYFNLPLVGDGTAERQGVDDYETRKKIRPPMEHFRDNIRTRCLFARVEQRHQRQQKIDNARDYLESKPMRDKLFQAKKDVIVAQAKLRQNAYVREIRSLAKSRENKVDTELLKMKRSTLSMRSLDRAAKTQKIESHAQRVKNFWQSREGQAQYKNMVRMGADISLATRKIHSNSPQLKNRETPTKQDIKIAERQARAFIESGETTMKASAIRAMHGCADKATEAVNRQRNKDGREQVKTPRINRVYSEIAGAKMTAKEFVDQARGQFRATDIMMPYEQKSVDDVAKEIDQSRDEAIAKMSEFDVDPNRSRVSEQLPSKESVQVNHSEMSVDDSRAITGELDKDRDLSEELDLDGAEIDPERSHSEELDKQTDKDIDPSQDRSVAYVEDRKIDKELDQKGERERNDQDIKDSDNKRFVQKASEIESNVSDEEAAESLESQLMNESLKRKGKEPEPQPARAPDNDEKEKKREQQQDQDKGKGIGDD